MLSYLTALLRLKSGQLIANQIYEFCYSYDYLNNTQLEPSRAVVPKCILTREIIPPHATGAWHEKNTSAKRKNPATGPRRCRSAKHPFLSCHASVGDDSAENMRPTNGKDACVERRRQKRDGEQATDVAEMG